MRPRPLVQLIGQNSPRRVAVMRQPWIAMRKRVLLPDLNHTKARAKVLSRAAGNFIVAVVVVTITTLLQLFFSLSLSLPPPLKDTTTARRVMGKYDGEREREREIQSEIGRVA